MLSGRFSQYPADGKRAGQKVQRKIAVAVQNVKTIGAHSTTVLVFKTQKNSHLVLSLL